MRLFPILGLAKLLLATSVRFVLLKFWASTFRDSFLPQIWKNSQYMILMFSFLRNPYVLAGAGGIALLGATIHQYANNVSQNTGFHFRDKDPTLRIVEKDVVIPKYMTDNAQKVKCKPEALAFRQCVDETEPNTWARFMTFRTCKKQSEVMMDCMNRYFTDYDFYLENKRVYLRDKALFQMSKVLKKDRAKIKEMIKNPEIHLKLDEDARTYYSAVKEHYEKTGNIDTFDDLILSNHITKSLGDSMASSVS